MLPLYAGLIRGRTHVHKTHYNDGEFIKLTQLVTIVALGLHQPGVYRVVPSFPTRTQTEPPITFTLGLPLRVSSGYSRVSPYQRSYPHWANKSQNHSTASSELTALSPVPTPTVPATSA